MPLNIGDAFGRGTATSMIRVTVVYTSLPLSAMWASLDVPDPWILS